MLTLRNTDTGCTFVLVVTLSFSVPTQSQDCGIKVALIVSYTIVQTIVSCIDLTYQALCKRVLDSINVILCDAGLEYRAHIILEVIEDIVHLICILTEFHFGTSGKISGTTVNFHLNACRIFNRSIKFKLLGTGSLLEVLATH